MRSVKINFVDMPSDFNKEKHWITRVLSKRYNVVFSEEPEFLFYGSFGLTFDGYKNCVKIMLSGEDEIPNFNDCDYAMGYDPITFGDRYIRADIGESYGTSICNSDWVRVGIKNDGWVNCGLIDIKENIQDRRIVTSELFHRRFCNFIYSNDRSGDGAVIRKAFCQELMKYKHVDCPGKILNNMDNAIGSRWVRKNGVDGLDINWAKEKLEFIKNYKFTIAFENISMNGHTTEKLIHPIYAYSIPIYWGNPEVVKDFNPKAFINCNDFNNDMEAVIERVIELDNDEAQYLSMLLEPPMQSSFDFRMEERAINFLYNIIEKGNNPYPKCPLESTLSNQARQAYRELATIRGTDVFLESRACMELQEIKSSEAWKLIKILRIISDSRWGKLLKIIFKKVLSMFNDKS